MTNKQVIWRYSEDVNSYRMFDVVNQPAGFDLLDVFKTGERINNKWIPIKIKLWEEQGEEKKSIADFISAGTAPAINEKAKSIIFPLVSNTVEFLPLLTKKGQYYVMNVEIVDCLDINKSSVERFKSSNRIMSVEKFAFIWNNLEGINMFRIPELGLSRLFVSDVLRKKIQESNLTGVQFLPIPMSEE
jgi:hypothetical protein